MRPVLRPFWLLLALVAAACSREPGEAALGPDCAENLAIAEQELQAARTEGFGESVALTRAASLIGAARVQQGFSEYENCVLKAREARVYLRQVRR